MAEPSEEPTGERAEERHRDLDRYLTFVDAIVAIAITLLVLPLVDAVADVGAHDSVAGLLREHRDQLGAFVLSFAVIYRLWFVQHRAVRPLLLMDTRIAQLLGLWAVTIVFLPFPTALVAAAGEQATTKVLYVGTTVASLVALGVIELLVARRPEITDRDDLPDPLGAVVNVGLLLAALAVMLLAPATSYFPMLLLAVDDPVTRGVRRLLRR